MIRVCKWLVPKGYQAITLYPFIFLSVRPTANDSTLINHERIHLRQQAELLIVFFYLWYLLDFLWKYIKYRNWQKAYRNIIFEREAYNNERNLNYLKVRGLWWFWGYK